MDSKTKTSIIIGAAACLMVTLVAVAVVVTVMVKNQSANQLAIQQITEKNAADMAEMVRQNKLDVEMAVRKKTLELEARAEAEEIRKAKADPNYGKEKADAILKEFTDNLKKRTGQ